MRPDIYRLLWMLVSTAVFVASGFSSPLNSKLLSLVPTGAELVGGFENHPDGRRAGRLLLATRNDRVDLDDWQALAGVDSKRVIDEVIEVAAASSTGRLTEHLLLVAGKFDREKIFHAAELNGAERGQYEGETILLIKPFAREQHEMLDTRWLMILNNRIAMLGTQPMVQKALYRYTTHADIDMPLMERLSQMRPDVSSWNVVVGSPNVENSLSLTQPNSMLTRLIKGAAVLMIGTRFGHKIRVDSRCSMLAARPHYRIRRRHHLPMSLRKNRPFPLLRGIRRNAGSETSILSRIVPRAPSNSLKKNFESGASWEDLGDQCQ